jgi:hypothetical protein
MVPAADDPVPASGSSVTGRLILSAFDHAPYAVRSGREASIVIISREKTAKGPIGCIVTDKAVISTIQRNKLAALRK